MFFAEEKYMKRCFQLAGGGEGETSPNPMVGAVIVHDGKIIGEGFHRKAGETHAEVNAITSVKNEELLKDSTMYVSLEPCSHYGKTPPCTGLIIRKGIPRVAIGCLDPFPEVSGRGIRILREAGIDIITGMLEKEARQLNPAFITLQEKQRPYIILKWAQSKDGYIDSGRKGSGEAPVKFSNPASRRLVHKLRSEVSAIMVGTNTALLDNPSLNIRHWAGRNPVRVVLDKSLRIPDNYKLLDDSTPTIIFTGEKAHSKGNTSYITIDYTKPVLTQTLAELKSRKLDSLLVEGGSELLTSFIREELWDEIRVETAPFHLHGGVAAPVIPRNIPGRPHPLFPEIMTFMNPLFSSRSV